MDGGDLATWTGAVVAGAGVVATIYIYRRPRGAIADVADEHRRRTHEVLDAIESALDPICLGNPLLRAEPGFQTMTQARKDLESIAKQVPRLASKIGLLSAQIRAVEALSASYEIFDLQDRLNAFMQSAPDLLSKNFDKAKVDNLAQSIRKQAGTVAAQIHEAREARTTLSALRKLVTR